MAHRPHQHTRLVPFLDRRILELSPRKSQLQIAAEAGFPNPNMLSMIKTGASKLPLDRVPDLARALDVDPGRLLQLALEQSVGDTAARALAETFEVVTTNERVWLAEIRDVSGNSDPALTVRLRAAFRALFGKS